MIPTVFVHRNVGDSTNSTSFCWIIGRALLHPTKEYRRPRPQPYQPLPSPQEVLPVSVRSASYKLKYSPSQVGWIW